MFTINNFSLFYPKISSKLVKVGPDESTDKHVPSKTKGLVGAYKYQKAPKYRKATKIPESTYKYQKARRNIGKMML